MPERGRIHVAFRAVLLSAGLVVLGLLFTRLTTLLLLVLMTVIIAIPLAALATKLEQRGVPRPAGVFLGILAGLLVVAGVLALVIPTFVDQGETFVDNVPDIVDDLRRHVDDAAGTDRSDVGTSAQDYIQDYTDNPDKLVGPLASVGLGVAGALGTILLILITAYYMAVNPGPLVESGLRLVPPARRARAMHILCRLRDSWIGWLQGVAFDMVISGILIYVGLSLIGLDFAIVFAVLSAVLVVIPYFGAFIGGIPPVLFALADSPGKALLVLAVYVAVQQIEGNLIIPLVMSRTVKLHPAVIAVGVVVVGQVFGFVGLFVAVPILSAIVIGMEELYILPMELADRRRAAEELSLPSDAIPPDPLDREAAPGVRRA